VSLTQPYYPDALRAKIGTLEALSLQDLRTEWRKLYHRTAPRFFRRELLIRGIAYELQAKVFGGLSTRTRALLRKIAKQAETGGFTAADMPRYLRPGTRLVRAWKGVTHTVDVLEDGFAWNGERYRSLSAIARAISGTNWNGNTFFGLGRKKSAGAGLFDA
jgi:hypothetical protein